MNVSAKTKNKDLPNIILIVLDTLRADHLPMYGYHRQTTPFLERLAEQGTVYLNAIAPEVWTLPSHASLFTGTYPSTHQTNHKNRFLPSNFVTLAEVLKTVGYRCGGASNNAWVSQMSGLDRGFDQFFLGGRVVKAAEVGGEYVDRGILSLPAYIINKGYRQFFKMQYGDGAPWINKKAMKWVKSSAGEGPFFLFLNYKEPHLFYTPSEKYRNQFCNSKGNTRRCSSVNQDAFKYMAGKVAMADEDFEILRALYDAEIRGLDDYLRELFTFLIDQGHLDNSLIVITSDHGENIGEHNLMDHQYCVYDTLARIPLIVVRLGDFQRQTTSINQVQLHDVFPTVLDLLGISGEVREQNQAQSLLDYDRREFTIVEYLSTADHVMKRRFPDVCLAPFQRTFRAIRTEQYKLIQSSNGNDELYDLTTDAGEQNNLIDLMPDVAQDLSCNLSKWTIQHKISDHKLTVANEFDRDIEDRLKDLGYL